MICLEFGDVWSLMPGKYSGDVLIYEVTGSVRQVFTHPTTNIYWKIPVCIPVDVYQCVFVLVSMQMSTVNSLTSQVCHSHVPERHTKGYLHNTNQSGFSISTFCHTL